MTTNEPRSIHAAEDWGVVLQSVPSKHKKDIVKRLSDIFELDKHDAEQVLSNMPLILVDNLSFALAARIKKYFQKIGAVAETTNHDMIKKNCFQVVWPQMPELSFFMKDETKPAEISTGKKTEESREVKPEPQQVQDVPAPMPIQSGETDTEIAKPKEEPPAAAPDLQPVVEERPAQPSPAGMDSEWEKRANELNEKLRRIQDEKEQLRDQHAEATEKVKSEFQQRIEQEKQKSGEIAKAYEDLRAQAQKQEALTKEGEEWRSKAMALGEKVRELETDLMQKTSAIEHLIQQKDDFERKAGQAAELSARIADLEKNIAEKNEEKANLQSRVGECQSSISDLERSVSEARRELESSRNHEQQSLQRVAGLERNIEEMKESLKARDSTLAQFEKQVLELAEKAREYESLRREHAQLAQERATIRKEYDAKLVEQEVRLAKVEEEHRRYRSRADRKAAAATRELGEWVRGVDTVRQGLQKLILFLGSESAVLDTEKKFPLRSPLTRGPDAPNPEKT